MVIDESGHWFQSVLVQLLSDAIEHSFNAKKQNNHSDKKYNQVKFDNFDMCISTAYSILLLWIRV